MIFIKRQIRILHAVSYLISCPYLLHFNSHEKKNFSGGNRHLFCYLLYFLRLQGHPFNSYENHHTTIYHMNKQKTAIQEKCSYRPGSPEKPNFLRKFTRYSLLNVRDALRYIAFSWESLEYVFDSLCCPMVTAFYINFWWRQAHGIMRMGGLELFYFLNFFFQNKLNHLYFNFSPELFIIDLYMI